MVSCLAVGVVTLVGLGICSCTSAPGVVESGPQTVGEAEEIYREACASCHGLDGTGDGPVAPALKSAPTDLTRLSARHGGVYPRDLVIRTIEGDNRIASHGAREMPVWSTRFMPTGHGATAVAAIHARRQVELLAAYIESLQRR